MDSALHILQHSLGVDQYGCGDQYRNHFVTGKGSIDWPICNELVERGLMTVRRKHPLSGGDDCFFVTDAGKQHVAEHSPNPPAPTKASKAKARYQRFLEYGDGFESFKDYLYWDAAPSRSWNSNAVATNHTTSGE